MSKMIEWIYFIDLSDDKRFYLYILFIIIKNSILLNDLYIYDNIIYSILMNNEIVFWWK